MEHLERELLNAAFHSASIGMALVGLNGEWLRVNQAVCDIVGYSEEELLKLTFQQITHPDDLDADLALLAQLRQGAIPDYELEKRYLHKDGRIVWIRLSVGLARDRAGQPLVYVSQIQDVTALRAATQARETLFRLPVALYYIFSFDGHFVQLSPGWADLLGYPIEHLLTTPFMELVHPDDRERTRARAARLGQAVDSVLFENRYLHADGSVRWLLWSSITVPEEQRRYGVALDNTERKEAELALERSLREKEALLSALRAAEDERMRLRAGLVTMCAWTKKIRVGDRWIPVDEYLQEHLQLNLTHGISEEAMQTALAEINPGRFLPGFAKEDDATGRATAI